MGCVLDEITKNVQTGARCETGSFRLGTERRTTWTRNTYRGIRAEDGLSVGVSKVVGLHSSRIRHWTTPWMQRHFFVLLGLIRQKRIWTSFSRFGEVADVVRHSSYSSSATFLSPPTQFSRRIARVMSVCEAFRPDCTGPGEFLFNITLLCGRVVGTGEAIL